jgi:elongation factor Ts
LELIQQLRERTGMGMMDVKKALEQTSGDMEKAIEVLRKKGADVAAKRAGNDTSEGVVQAYIHPGSRIGVLLEIDCETDFVARTNDMKQFANDLCLQIAAMKPSWLNPEDVDQTFLSKEKEILRDQLAGSGKPEKVINQIVEGKLNKIYSEVCLMKQSFVKNDQLTIEDLLKEMIAKLGEKIVVRRFVRYEIGV